MTKNQESQQGLNTKRPKKKLTEQTFGRIFLKFLWWLWDCKCGWRWSIRPEEILSQPVICKAMSVCRILCCAQDSKETSSPSQGQEGLCKHLLDCALIVPLNTGVVDQSPNSVLSVTCSKFLFKGIWIKLWSQSIPHSYAWFLIHTFLKILSCFFKAYKPILPPIVLGCLGRVFPTPPIPSAQVKTSQQNQ